MQRKKKKNDTTFARLLGRSCQRHLELCSRLTIYRQTKRRRLRNIPHRDLVVPRDLSLFGVFAARRDTARVCLLSWHANSYCYGAESLWTLRQEANRARVYLSCRPCLFQSFFFFPLLPPLVCWPLASDVHTLIYSGCSDKVTPLSCLK